VKDQEDVDCDIFSPLHPEVFPFGSFDCSRADQRTLPVWSAFFVEVYRTPDDLLGVRQIFVADLSEDNISMIRWIDLEAIPGFRI
jgi:hypothetical protein